MPITGTQKNKLMRNDLFHLAENSKPNLCTQVKRKTLVVFLQEVMDVKKKKKKKKLKAAKKVMLKFHYSYFR